MAVLVQVDRADVKRLMNVSKEMDEEHEGVAFGEVERRGGSLAAQYGDGGVDRVDHVVIISADQTGRIGGALQRNVDEGRIGFKTKRGFFEWNDESIAKERARYERALRKCLEIFREEGIL